MTERPTSFSSFSYAWTYDVFLSFRGEDTRRGFTGNLYKALCDKGIRTFMDDEELRKGQEITSTLLEAIENSRMAIIVFSMNYASSTYCLEELVKILESIKGNGRCVWPIFYEVDPSDVRHQRGTYGEALVNHEQQFKHKERVQTWKLALQEAADLTGSHYRHGYEYEFIQKIVEELSRKTNRSPLHVANYPVGLESHVQKVNSLLDVGSNEGVNMVGIYGIGGIGKTTIACAVYNSIADQFEGLCFLADIRENSMKHGLVQLQERLLLELVGEKNAKLDTIKKGIPTIKNKLHRKKVLLILDDVDELKQLQALAGGVDWFGSGSKIIITTRNKHLLDTHGVKRTYEVQGLKYKEALELFSWSAFKKTEVDTSYMGITNRVVDYCNGLPLALEIIGCNLFGKRLDEWKSALDSYQRIPNKNIYEILKRSYDSLEEEEKIIFLDMACFFKGWELSYVKRILLEGRGFSPEHGISVLIDKSLIKIDQHNCVRIHDIIEHLGREIVRQESPSNPGKRSRLWFYEDILLVLEDNLGTDNVEVIMLHLPEDKDVQWKGNELKQMKSLKILIINENARFSTRPEYFPKSLRVLKWPRFPAPSLPSNFDPHKLVSLDLSNSYITLDKPFMNFKCLSCLNLSNCDDLKQVPDMTGAPILRKLYLNKCKNLVQVHDSVGLLQKLELLTARRCTKLRILPCCFNLTSLKDLYLNGCSSLQSFPEIVGKMEKLKTIVLSGSGIEDLPSSFGCLIGLEVLHLTRCRRLFGLPSSVLRLPRLRTLSARKCKVFRRSMVKGQEQERVAFLVSLNLRCVILRYSDLTDGFLATYLPCLLNVEELDLGGTNITILPADINRCQFLKALFLENCSYLREIRGIPPNIRQMRATNCISLTCQAQSILLSQAIHDTEDTVFLLPGSRVPEWFDHSRRGSSLSFWFRNKLPDIAFCFVFAPPFDIRGRYRLLFNGIHELFYPNYFDYTLETDHIMLSSLQSCFWDVLPEGLYMEDGWNHVEISYEETSIQVIKWIGVHVHKQKTRMQDIRFTDPNPQNPTIVYCEFCNFTHVLNVNIDQSQQKYPASQDMEICEAPDLKKTCDGLQNCHPDLNLQKYHKGKSTNMYLENWDPYREKYPALWEKRQVYYADDKVSQSSYEALISIEATPKVKILLWNICRRNLPTYEFLFRMKRAYSPVCPICGVEPETVEHVFLFCPWTRPIWFASDFQWSIDVDSVPSFQVWLCQKLAQIERVHPNANKFSALVGNICWAIWKGRNEFVLEDRPIDPWRALLNLGVRTPRDDKGIGKPGEPNPVAPFKRKRGIGVFQLAKRRRESTVSGNHEQCCCE